jgi:hypothetical protein
MVEQLLLRRCDQKRQRFVKRQQRWKPRAHVYPQGLDGLTRQCHPIRGRLLSWMDAPACPASPGQHVGIERRE